MNAPAASRPLLSAAAALTALGLAALSVAVGHQHGCTTGQLEGWNLCAPDPDAPGSARARIARDPGDASAYMALARSLPSASREGALKAAERVAPNDPHLLLLQAAAAAQRNDVAAMVRPLVTLAEHTVDPPAPMALAELVDGGQGAALLPYVRPGSRWLFHVLRYVRERPGAMTRAVPLISRGLQVRALSREQVAGFVADLKKAGAWRDAYGLWALLHPQGVPLLYNGSFELPLNAGAFNWETLPAHQQPGVVIERLSAGGTHKTLELSFSSRMVASPVLRQYVFALPGPYLLEGDFRASRMRLGGGLGWTVTCERSGWSESSDPLEDSGGAWQALRFEFRIPPDCGDVVRLDLHPLAESDARAGGTGRLGLKQLRLAAASVQSARK